MNIWPKPEDFDQQGLLKSGQSPPNTASESEDSEEHTADWLGRDGRGDIRNTDCWAKSSDFGRVFAGLSPENLLKSGQRPPNMASEPEDSEEQA